MRCPLRAAVGAALLATACAGSPSAADQRADQARQAAADAGLAEDVQDFLALAAGAGDGTFQVTYSSDVGDVHTEVVLSQAGDDRRVDIVQGTTTETQMTVGGETYACHRADDTWTCATAAGVDASAVPLLDPDTIAATTGALAGSKDAFDFVVEHRSVLEVDATCLVTSSKSDDQVTGTLCVSAAGVALLVDVPSQHVEATAYRTDVPAGTFDLPAPVSAVP